MVWPCKKNECKDTKITVELEFENRDKLDDPGKDGSAKLQEQSC
jgi:hypothetical protein